MLACRGCQHSLSKHSKNLFPGRMDSCSLTFFPDSEIWKSNTLVRPSHQTHNWSITWLICMGCYKLAMEMCREKLFKRNGTSTGAIFCWSGETDLCHLAKQEILNLNPSFMSVLWYGKISLFFYYISSMTTPLVFGILLLFLIISFWVEVFALQLPEHPK